MRKLFFLLVAIATFSMSLTSCSKKDDILEVPVLVKISEQAQYRIVTAKITRKDETTYTDITDLISNQYGRTSKNDCLMQLLSNKAGTTKDKVLGSKIYTSDYSFGLTVQEINSNTISFEFDNIWNQPFAGGTGQNQTRPPYSIIWIEELFREVDESNNSYNYWFRIEGLDGNYVVTEEGDGFTLTRTKNDYTVEIQLSKNL